MTTPTASSASRTPHTPAASAAPVPASGAWQPAQGAGHRRFAQLGEVPLESGRILPEVTLAYETWGELAADGSNAVLVLHALTGDSHVVGEAGPAHPTAGWWSDLVGPGRAVDTDEYFVVAPNVLGGCQGSTGPSSPAPDGSPWGSRFPRVTMRDQVEAERALAAVLGIERWSLVIGGSMGGMRALEWAVTAPEQVERLAVIASSARASADQIAWNSTQIAAIRGDVGFHGGDYYGLPDGEGPHLGLGTARRIAHITYRTGAEFEERFSNRSQGEEDVLGGGRHQVTSYLDHHADKLARRFDANSYVRLAESMSTHDVGRGRGGTAAALRRISARTLLIAITTDRLFPPALVAETAEGIEDVRHHVVDSPVGHDGFLLPHPALREWIADLLRG
jgi:homoserine O-acetyltransferase